jgi:hypothetical protein
MKSLIGAFHPTRRKQEMRKSLEEFGRAIGTFSALAWLMVALWAAARIAGHSGS